MAEILVVGSSNTDLVVACPHIPRPGETVIGGDLAVLRGGKGANQAVAAARLGSSVTLIACVGTDDFGDAALAGLQSEGIDTSFVVRDTDAPSGVALICVDESGENAIAVAPGANRGLLPNHISAARQAFERATIVLVQLEIPLDTVAETVRTASEAGVPVILNPAPAQPLDADILSGVRLVTPNQTEAAILCDVDPEAAENPDVLARSLPASGCPRAVLTLGSRGSVIVEGSSARHVPAFPVSPVDTTAAGDAFNGALALALAEGKSLPLAVRFASACAAISVTRPGAQPSMPMRSEVEKMLRTAA